MKVYPRYVAEVLFEHPAIRKTAVVATSDIFSDEVFKAHIALKDLGSKLTGRDIISYCAQKFVRFKVPKKMEFLPELSKSPIGNVLRRKLTESTSQQS